MPNQELLKYIQQQLQNGINPEQIKSSLLSNGWQQKDVETAFSQTNQASSSKINLSIKENPSPKASFFTLKTLVVLLIIVLFLAGGTFASFMFMKPNNMKQVENKSIVQQTITSTPIPSPREPSDPIATNLISCKSYQTTFVHPFSGETLQKEILGIVNDECIYIEEMPNEGKMECRYSESERMEIAKYYINVENAESGTTSASADLVTGEKKVKYTLNGREVENPLQEAIDTGICIISGY